MRYDPFMFSDRVMEMHALEEHWQDSIRRMAPEERRDRKGRLSQHWALGLYRLGNGLKRFGLWLQRSAQPTDSLAAG